MEGALILCRAEDGSGPLEAVAQELMRLLPPVSGPASRAVIARTRSARHTGATDE